MKAKVNSNLKSFSLFDPSNSKNEKKMGFIYYQNKSIFVIFCFFTNNKNEYI